jgi:preprotein translocase subunit Sss1
MSFLWQYNWGVFLVIGFILYLIGSSLENNIGRDDFNNPVQITGMVFLLIGVLIVSLKLRLANMEKRVERRRNRRR